MNGTGIIVACPSCGAKNRIPEGRWGCHAMCGRCKTPLHVSRIFPDRVVDISDSTFKAEVLDHPGPVIVDFTAPW